MSIDNVVLVGEAVAGESATLRKSVEKLISSLSNSSFDLGDLLKKIKQKGHFREWGFNTMPEYIGTLDIKSQKAGYLLKISEVMEQVAISRDKYEPVGIAKLRAITSLDPTGSWTNPETQEVTPLSEFIVGFVEKADELSLEQIKTHVRTLKGFTGENDFAFLSVSIKRSVLDEIVRPALEAAKAAIGSVGKDEDGNSVDASDGRALEVIAVEYLNDPANNVLPEAEVQY